MPLRGYLKVLCESCTLGDIKYYTARAIAEHQASL